MNKNQKISKALKHHHKHKKVIKEVKTLLWIIFIITLICQFRPAGVIAEEKFTKNYHLPVAEDIEMTVPLEIRKIANQMGFKWTDYLLRLADCESKFNPNAINNKNNNPSFSVDRGVFQINNYWHPDVSDECAFDVDCATRWTIQKINSGQQGLWVCNNLI
jgi:hypothetical protein